MRGVDTHKILVFLLALYSVALLTSMAGLEIFGWALVLVVLCQLANKNSKLQETTSKLGPDLWIGCFFAWVVVSSFMNHESVKETVDMIGWARWIVLLYVFTWILRQELQASFERWHLFLFGIAGVLALYAFLQFYFGYEMIRSKNGLGTAGDFYRAMGFFNISLTFAYTIGMLGMTALGYAIVSGATRPINDRRTVWGLFGFMFCGFAVLFTQARGAWIAFGVTTLIGGMFASRRIWGAISVPLLSVFAFFLYHRQHLTERFLDMVNTGSESTRLRILTWKANILMWQDYPLFGVGVGQNAKKVQPYYAKLGFPLETFRSHAHNDLLQTLVATGVVGFLAYVGFCTWFLVAAYRLYFRISADQVWYRGLALGSFLAQIYFHIGGLTQCNFTNAINSHFLIFMWALTLALWSRFPLCARDTFESI